jgi:hypothetical protein
MEDTVTEQERYLAIRVADIKAGMAHNIMTDMMRRIIIECIEEFCKLQEIEKRS